MRGTPRRRLRQVQPKSASANPTLGFGLFFCSPLPMAVSVFHLLLLFVASLVGTLRSSPHLSPSTFHRNYRHMVENLKIFAYDGPTAIFPASSSVTLFHAALLRSHFLTTDPDEAYLFYLPFPSSQSPRSISRTIRAVRSDLPFWNRTLGADHFYLSLDGIGTESDRNLVELKKNAVQISPFPAISGRFIPHKDLTLPSPPLFQDPPVLAGNRTFAFLAFYGGVENPQISTILDDLRRDPQFLIESRPLDPVDLAEKMSVSRFCLFFHGVSGEAIGEALGFGCVPVVIADRPILDLPFGDVLRWSEIAVFVRLAGGAEEVRRAMDRRCGERYARMREAGAQVSVHFRWSTPDAPQPYDAFLSVMFQLWLRRHTIRYARRESGFEGSDG